MPPKKAAQATKKAPAKKPSPRNPSKAKPRKPSKAKPQAKKTKTQAKESKPSSKIFSRSAVVPGVSAAEIERAAKRIRPVIHVTSLERSNSLSQKFGANVMIKHEEQQYCGAFKLRGATNHLMLLPKAQKAKGCITATTGNHGMAVAYAANHLGIKSTVYLCDNVPQNKVEIIKGYGATVKHVKGWCLEAQIAAFAESKKTGSYYIPPYNHPKTVNGAGTCGLEIWERMKSLGKRIDAVFGCVGGGGLMSGVATYLKARDPSILVYACSARRCPAMYESVKAGKVVTIPPTLPSVADGNGGNLEPDSITVEIFKKNVTEVVLLEEQEIRDATRMFIEHERTIAEPTAALALAGYVKKAREFKGKNVVVITCGRNMDTKKMLEILTQ